MPDKVAGHLIVALTPAANEVVINFDEPTGHVVFSPNQSRNLATLLWKKAGQAEGIRVGRLITFGRYAVISVEGGTWSVHRIGDSDDPDDIGVALGEFIDQLDAELFAEAKFETDASAVLDHQRDKYDVEPIDCRDYPV